jgi:uncharacterized protein (TIGR02996 family)
MTDLDTLLAGIIENPAELDRRLVYADALEERGSRADMVHAQLIRHQMMVPGVSLPDVGLLMPACDNWNWQISYGHSPSVVSCHDRTLRDHRVLVMWEKGFVSTLSCQAILMNDLLGKFLARQPMQIIVYRCNVARRHNLRHDGSRYSWGKNPKVHPSAQWLVPQCLWTYLATSFYDEVFYSSQDEALNALQQAIESYLYDLREEWMCDESGNPVA